MAELKAFECGISDVKPPPPPPYSGAKVCSDVYACDDVKAKADTKNYDDDAKSADGDGKLIVRDLEPADPRQFQSRPAEVSYPSGRPTDGGPGPLFANDADGDCDEVINVCDVSTPYR
nr:hypothetical protein BaRGS_016338 [Batillaria attramentaria]